MGSAVALDGGHEAIAPAADRRYVTIAGTALSERPPQCSDQDLEITLRHAGVRPNADDQFVLADHFASMLNEHLQELQASCTEIDRLLTLNQKLLFWNQSERAE
jgi:hypothetical protein